MKRLQDKVAVITGGGSGIGAATAALFVQEGARVVVVGRNEEKLRKTVQTINHENVSYTVADVSQAEDTLVEDRLPEQHREARGLQGRAVGVLVPRVGNGEVDVDDRLGGQARHRGGADVLDREGDVSERGAEARGELLECIGPGWIVRHHLDVLALRRGNEVLDAVRVVLVVADDLRCAGHGDRV